MNYILKIPANFRGTYPFAGKVFIVGSGLCLLLSGYSWIQANSAQRQLQWRKNQLSLPIYRLSEQQHINPPWNAENINQWLYRRVEVGGRVLHRSQMLIYTQSNGADGYQYVVPLLVRQQKDRSNQQGLILSKGFLPFSCRDIGTRYRIQNSGYQKFVGFVSKLPQLQNTSLIHGNSLDDQKRQFNCADTQDFAKSAGFTNQKQAGVAVIERLHENGVLDERRSERRHLGCEGTQNYPYPKTQTGALQLQKMPWDYKNDAKMYFWSSLGSLVLGASIF